MRVTLIHNPGAGGSARSEPLVALAQKAGHRITCRSTTSPRWSQALDQGADLVAVAGGDGTVAEVAKRLVGSGVPLGILPVGSANNIAKSLGITVTPEELVVNWESAGRKRLDLGVARGPWGERRFVEGVGVGLFSRMLGLLNTESQRAVAQSAKQDDGFGAPLKLLHGISGDYRGREWKIRVDGQDLSGRYTLVEAMNIRFLGPNLDLAPEADPGDGWLDVAFLGEHQTPAFLDYLSRRLGGEPVLPSLTVRRARHVWLSGEDSEVHIDDWTWPPQAIEPAGEVPPCFRVTMDLTLSDRSVEVLV